MPAEICPLCKEAPSDLPLFAHLWTCHFQPYYGSVTFNGKPVDVAQRQCWCGQPTPTFVSMINHFAQEGGLLQHYLVERCLARK